MIYSELVSQLKTAPLVCFASFALYRGPRNILLWIMFLGSFVAVREPENLGIRRKDHAYIETVR